MSLDTNAARSRLRLGPRTGQNGMQVDNIDSLTQSVLRS